MSLHEVNISKKRKIIGYGLSAYATTVFIFSSSTKLLEIDFMMDSMNKIGISQFTVFIAILELFCLALYWIPKTMNIGFFLLCSYIGGAIVGELVAGLIPPLPSVSVAIALYLGSMMRKPSLSGLSL